MKQPVFFSSKQRVEVEAQLQTVTTSLQLVMVGRVCLPRESEP